MRYVDAFGRDILVDMTVVHSKNTGQLSKSKVVSLNGSYIAIKNKHNICHTLPGKIREDVCTIAGAMVVEPTTLSSVEHKNKRHKETHTYSLDELEALEASEASSRDTCVNCAGVGIVKIGSTKTSVLCKFCRGRGYWRPHEECETRHASLHDALGCYTCTSAARMNRAYSLLRLEKNRDKID